MATTRTRLDQQARKFAYTHSRLLVQLPGPYRRWTLAGVDAPISGAVARNFRQRGLLEHAGMAQTAAGNGIRFWRLTAAGWRAQQRLVAQPTTPCGDTGFRTVVAGETYTCRDDDCGCLFDRERAERIASAERTVLRGGHDG